MADLKLALGKRFSSFSSFTEVELALSTFLKKAGPRPLYECVLIESNERDLVLGIQVNDSILHL